MIRNILVVLAISLFAVPAFAASNAAKEDIGSRMYSTARENIKFISPATLQSWIGNKKDFLLLDVREPDEVEAARIDAKKQVEIPRGVVELLFPQKVEKDDTIVVVYCLLGIRSAVVADALTKYGYKNVYSLDGGIVRWIKSGYPVSNFIGSFEMKNFESRWLEMIPKAEPAAK